jgi:hypothetical protein
MSRKITAKNLQYNTTLPPFLARLRGQHASETDRDAPDPILAARRRPAKPRSGSAEAEDAPLVVDEHGNTVDVTVGADGNVKEKEGQAESAAEDAQNDGDGKSNSVVADGAAGEKLPGVIQAGAQRKKRKLGRVIGAGDTDEGDDNEERDGNEKGGAKRSKPATATTEQEPPQERDDSSAAAPKAKTKKKAKKIKLSFGDDEG